MIPSCERLALPDPAQSLSRGAIDPRPAAGKHPIFPPPPGPHQAEYMKPFSSRQLFPCDAPGGGIAGDVRECGDAPVPGRSG